MKTFTASCFLLAVTSHLTYAQSTCDASVGIPITDDVSSSSADYTTSSAGDCDATCQMFLMDQQSSLNDNLNDAIAAGGDSFLAAAGGKRDLEHPVLRRQGLSMTCSVTESCFVYDSIPFCIDVNTGDFADPSGGTGNILTGVYVPAESSGGTGTDSKEEATATSTVRGGNSGPTSASVSHSSQVPNGVSSSSVGTMTIYSIALLTVVAIFDV